MVFTSQRIYLWKAHGKYYPLAPLDPNPTDIKLPHTFVLYPRITRLSTYTFFGISSILPIPHPPKMCAICLGESHTDCWVVQFSLLFLKSFSVNTYMWSNNFLFSVWLLSLSSLVCRLLHTTFNCIIHHTLRRLWQTWLTEGIIIELEVNKQTPSGSIFNVQYGSDTLPFFNFPLNFVIEIINWPLLDVLRFAALWLKTSFDAFCIYPARPKLGIKQSANLVGDTTFYFLLNKE